MEWNRQIAAFSALAKFLHGHLSTVEMIDWNLTVHQADSFRQCVGNRTRQVRTAKEKPAAEIHGYNGSVQFRVLARG